MATPPQHPLPPPGNPFAPQGGHAPNTPPQQQAYGQPQAPGYGQPQAPGYGQNPAYGGHPGTQQYVCRLCAAQPAGDITIRQHTGLLIAMRFSKMQGPLCRSCATALNRDMTAKTLAGGWWSPFSLVVFTPFTLLWNLYCHMKAKKLAHPSPSPAGIRLDQGKLLLHRPIAYVAVIPALWFCWVLVMIFTQP
ncbi:hypothetical protein ACFY93_31530 [Streptomyces sp. NPDC008313]|uniref:hypothetical protein n=1 Tax=Streptomyces sp. NPDC008313 TaxID=3364826 RepID=UPI0036E0AAF4